MELFVGVQGWPGPCRADAEPQGMLRPLKSILLRGFRRSTGEKAKPVTATSMHHRSRPTATSAWCNCTVDANESSEHTSTFRAIRWTVHKRSLHRLTSQNAFPHEARHVRHHRIAEHSQALWSTGNPEVRFGKPRVGRAVLSREQDRSSRSRSQGVRSAGTVPPNSG
jgi:hypothetical protein